MRTQKKTVFIKNDKSKITIEQKWIKEKTKNLYRKIDSSMKPQSLTYQQIQNDLIENINSNRSDFQFECFNNLKSERDRWNFINETKNSKRTKQKYSVWKTVLATLSLTKNELQTYWTTDFQN